MCWPPSRRCAAAASTSSSRTTFTPSRAARSPSLILAASCSSWCTMNADDRVVEGAGPAALPNIGDFGMDTISLAGMLPSKLTAVREAGFSQIMLSARDVVDHPDGFDAAVRAVRRSGLRVTGFQVLRDFEGLSGHLHDYKIDVAKSMLEMCHALGSTVLLVCSSTSTHATGDPDALAADLRKLAMLAIPLGINVAYEGLSWGRSVSEYTVAWDIVCRANAPNLGLGLDSYHIFATKSSLDDLDLLLPEKIFLVQLADFMWQEVRTAEERIATARHFRVFPGEGVHSA